MNPIFLNVLFGLVGFVLGGGAMVALVIWRMGWRLDITKWQMTGTFLDGTTYYKEGLYVGKESYERVR